MFGFWLMVSGNHHFRIQWQSASPHISYLALFVIRAYDGPCFIFSVIFCASGALDHFPGRCGVRVAKINYFFFRMIFVKSLGKMNMFMKQIIFESFLGAGGSYRGEWVNLPLSILHLFWSLKAPNNQFLYFFWTKYRIFLRIVLNNKSESISTFGTFLCTFFRVSGRQIQVFCAKTGAPLGYNYYTLAAKDQALEGILIKTAITWIGTGNTIFSVSRETTRFKLHQMLPWRQRDLKRPVDFANRKARWAWVPTRTH